MRNNIAIIIEREYKTRVAKKSFILTTILAPIVFALIVSVPIILAKMSSDTKKVALIDRTGLYKDILKNTEEYEFVLADKSISEYRDMGEDSGFDAIVTIDESLINNPNSVTIFSYNQLPEGIERYIRDVLNKHIYEEKVKSYQDIPNLKSVLQDLDTNISIATFKWDKDGNQARSSSELSSVIGFSLTSLSYFFIFLYGSMVLQGVLEEKKNKIMEVMVSTVKPFDMMMGKIIGIGLVGITQMLIWIILGTILMIAAQFIFLGDVYTSESLMAMKSTGLNGMSSADIEELAEMMGYVEGINFFEIFLMFILFFVGGFLLYSSMFAAIGSAVSSDEDTAQLMMPISFIMIFSFYVGIASVENPSGTLATVCSLIPFTSPVVMMVRIPFDVPIWQEVLSIVILFASFIGMTYLSAKIYRVGILMYGKKPSFKELWKWLRYK